MAELVTPPAKADVLALVSVAQFKAAKRITNTREDAFIEDCILDSWAFIDGPNGKVRRAVLDQTWAFTARAFPTSGWRIPVYGARQITEVSYYPPFGPAATLGSALYALESPGEDATITFAGGFWPPALALRSDAVRVTVKAGWAAPDKVPREFRRALLLLAAHYYENREETFSDNRVSVVSRRIELGLDKLLEKYVVPIDYGRR